MLIRSSGSSSMSSSISSSSSGSYSCQAIVQSGSLPFIHTHTHVHTIRTVPADRNLVSPQLPHLTQSVSVYLRVCVRMFRSKEPTGTNDCLEGNVVVSIELYPEEFLSNHY